MVHKPGNDNVKYNNSNIGKTPEREYMVNPSPVLRGKKILVVDDNEASRKLVKKCLNAGMDDYVNKPIQISKIV